MTPDELLFFDSHPSALPLYEAVKEHITAEIPDVRIEVKKTQISFFKRHMLQQCHSPRSERQKNAPIAS